MPSSAVRCSTSSLRPTTGASCRASTPPIWCSARKPSSNRSMNSFPGRPSRPSKPNTWRPSLGTRSLPNSPKRSAVSSQPGSRAPASSIVLANPRSRSTTNLPSSCASRPPPTTSPPALPKGRTSARSSKLRPRSRQKEHLQPPRPPSHPARLQPPLPRIPLQSGRLLGWYPSARPSYPTPCRQRPHRQRPQLLQPRRADFACRPAPSQLQHQRPPPRRPRPADCPMLTANPPPTPRPPPPTRGHQTCHRHLSLLPHPRRPFRYCSRPQSHTTPHYSSTRPINLLTPCKHLACK